MYSPHIPKHLSISSAKITTNFVTCLEIQCFVNAQDMACVPPERNKIIVAGNITWRFYEGRTESAQKIIKNKQLCSFIPPWLCHPSSDQTFFKLFFFIFLTPLLRLGLAARFSWTITKNSLRACVENIFFVRETSFTGDTGRFRISKIGRMWGGCSSFSCQYLGYGKCGRIGYHVPGLS